MTKFLPPYSATTWKALGTVAGLLIVIALVLFTVDRCGTWSTNRDIEKRRTNVNAILANIETKETTIANLQTQVELEKQAANIETKALIEAANTSEAARVETNRALANLDAAKNANHANSSAKDLEDVLRRLEQ